MKLLSAIAQLYINYSLKQLCIQDSHLCIEMTYIVSKLFAFMQIVFFFFWIYCDSCCLRSWNPMIQLFLQIFANPVQRHLNLIKSIFVYKFPNSSCLYDEHKMLMKFGSTTKNTYIFLGIYLNIYIFIYIWTHVSVSLVAGKTTWQSSHVQEELCFGLSCRWSFE